MLRAAVVCVCMSLAGFAGAGTIYVDIDNTTGVEDGTAANPYNTIQEGLDNSAAGDVVTVAPGTYVEVLTFPGHDLTLTSENPLDPTVVGLTQVNGDLDGDYQTAHGSIITLAGTEVYDTLITGLTLLSGYTTGDGGAVNGNGAGARLSHSVLVNNNAAASGGGVYNLGGSIANCQFIMNDAGTSGGALADCGGEITHCVFNGNFAAVDGGAMHQCHGTIWRNEVYSNIANGGGGGFAWCNGTLYENEVYSNSATNGGGLANCYAWIQDSHIHGNHAWDNGGGLYVCSSSIQNCIITGNTAEDIGGAICDCDGTTSGCTIVGNYVDGNGGAMAWCDGWAYIVNCIMWGNSAGVGFDELYNCVDPTYCCIEGYTAPKDGTVINSDPLFVTAGYWDGAPGSSNWVEGDYHLSQTASGQAANSPCVDTGDPGWFPTGTTRTDSVPDAGTVDMGYHFDWIMSDWGPFIEVPLTKSWNLVGYMSQMRPNMPLALIRLSYDGRLLTWEEAVATGWVATNAYYCTTGVGYGALRVTGGDDDSFRCGRGYWVLNYLAEPMVMYFPAGHMMP